MKQVYAAGPLAARPTLAAASAGVRPDEIDAVLFAASYAQPADGEKPPVRLALLHTPAGRLLTHVAPHGDQLVAHALVDVPASADAQSAIQTWGSPQWQRHRPDRAGDLPELLGLPSADVLDDDSLKAWLTTPARRDLLEFIFTALLSTPADVRVVVAAPADDVAVAVYAVTRTLPTGMLDDFTFSTYEPDPTACRARLVGTTPTKTDDVPRLYPAGFAVYDPAAGVRTDLPAVPFAAYAVDAIAARQFAKLDELKALWQRLGLSDPRHFDLLDRLGRGAGVLTKDEAADAVQQPALAAWLSARGDAVNQFLEWALEDRQFASGAFTRVVQSLRQKPEVLAKLGQTVRDEGVKALKANDRERTATALEVVLPMVAPTKAGAVWGDLLGQLNDPDALPWAMRGYLLPKFARFRQQQGQTGVDPALAKWLSVPTERLGELLGTDLPRPYHEAAGKACLLRDGEPTDDLARTLGAYPALTLTLLKPEGDDARQAALFDKLLAVAPQVSWLDDIVAGGDDYPAATRTKFLEAALAASKVNPDLLIRTRGSRVLELFAGQPGLDRLTAALLAAPPDDLLRSAPLADFLDRSAAGPQASEPVKERAAAVKTAREFVQSPTFAAERLKAVAAAFRLSPVVLPAGGKGEAFNAVAADLARRIDTDAFQPDLESALVHLGGVLANDPADLCENLLRDLRSRTDLPRQPGPTTAFLAVTLGAAKSPELDGKLDGLDGAAFALAADAAKKGGGRLLDEIDRRTADWPKPARSRWGFLRTAVQPAGAGRYLRDAAFFLGGAALAAGVVLLVR